MKVSSHGLGGVLTDIGAGGVPAANSKRVESVEPAVGHREHLLIGRGSGPRFQGGEK